MDVTRRDMLKGAGIFAAGLAATGAVSALGCASEPAKEDAVDSNLPQTWDVETDVVVVGAGGAGLAAAAKAAEAGVGVLLLEKLDVLGGDTLHCGGLLYVGDSSLHKEAGIEYSTEKLWQAFYNGYGTKRTHIDLFKKTVESGPEALDWLLDIGVEMKAPTASSPNTCTVLPPYQMNALIDPMVAEAEALGVDIRTSTKMTKLWQDASGAIVGLEAQDASGAMINVKAKATILTTGHWTFNDELVEKYDRNNINAEHLNTLPAESSQGDGILAAKAVGAGLDGMSSGCTLKFQEPVISLMIRNQPLMMVDEAGNRFFNEDTAYEAGAAAMLKQGIPAGFYIFDEQTAQATYKDDIASGVEKGWIQKADTIEDLAAAAGIDAAGLAAQLAAYNDAATAGKDGQFGRDAGPLFIPLNQPPYYAWRCTPCRYKTSGGIMADVNSRVLAHSDETPIPGLYAAGATCGSVHANAMLAITSGRLAGESAAAEITQA